MPGAMESISEETMVSRNCQGQCCPLVSRLMVSVDCQVQWVLVKGNGLMEVTGVMVPENTFGNHSGC